MSEGYISVPFDVDPDSLADAIIDRFKAAWPDWQPADANLEVQLAAAVGRVVWEVMLLASTVTGDIFSAFGQDMVAVTQDDGSAATTTSTWTARDNSGHVIPAGTQVAYPRTADDQVVFEVAAQAEITAGSTSVSGVELRAIDVGATGNAVPAGALVPVDQMSWVSTVVSVTPSSGGTDPEADAAYRDRLAQRLRLMARTPIVAGDFAVLAADVDTVHRAICLDGWDPQTQTWDNPRTVCLAGVTSTGAAIGGTARSSVETYLAGLREVGFVVTTTDPTITAVDVAFTVATTPGHVAADVVAAAEAAVTAFLDPATWAGGDQSPPVWDTGRDTVRLFEVAALLAAVPGVAYVSALTIEGSAADHALPGVAPLPSPGTIAGTAA